MSAAQAQHAGGQPVDVPVQVRFDEALLRQQLGDLAAQSATTPVLAVLSDTETLTRSFAYAPGRSIDVEAALEEIDALLHRPGSRRSITLQMQPDRAADPLRPSPAQLEQQIDALSAEWEGIVGLYVYNMQSGEVIARNADTVFSGASIMKVAILLFGAISLPEPDEAVQAAAEAMIIVSDNLKANDVLAAAVGGQGTDAAYTGVLSMSAMLRHELGFEHTYMHMPYEAWDYLVGLRGLSIEQGPAQEGSPPYTSADPVVRTTPAEMSRLFC
ncbi:MAG: hypothetical protein HC828_16945 [Blastochloris sp.]|nr:hypothetical protein [Blastochloris sp.]